MTDVLILMSNATNSVVHYALIDLPGLTVQTKVVANVSEALSYLDTAEGAALAIVQHQPGSVTLDRSSLLDRLRAMAVPVIVLSTAGPLQWLVDQGLARYALGMPFRVQDLRTKALELLQPPTPSSASSP